MKWIPWISREHHEAVVAGKDALILSLEAQNAVLAERLAEPVKVTVEFPKRSDRPKQTDSPAKEKAPRKPKPLQEIDYSTLDERDPVQMARLALDEFGGKLPPPHVLGRWYAQVRMQTLYAKRKRQAQTDQMGNVGTIIVDELPKSPEAPQDPSISEVPQHILDLIAAAEGGQ